MMRKARKSVAEEVQPLKTVPFDDQDRAYMLPLIRKVADGDAAKKALEAYVGSIKRRSGIGEDQRIVMDKECTRMVAMPSDAKPA